eukprot:232446_1
MTQLNLFSSIILCITIDAEIHLSTQINSFSKSSMKITGQKTYTDNDITHYNKLSRVLLSDDTFSDWVLSSVALPYPMRGMAAAHFNNKIYLFGGIFDVRQRVVYDISLDKTIDHDLDALSAPIQGFAKQSGSYGRQFYTQIKHTLYFIDERWGTVIMYNLAKDNDYFYTIASIPQYETYNYESCLTSTTGLLFVTGQSAVFRIFNISSSLWLSSGNTYDDIPPMNTNRSFHSCVFDEIQNMLWVMGGDDGDSEYLQSVETISIVDDQHIGTEWDNSVYDLYYKVVSASAAWYQGFIFVMGGHTLEYDTQYSGYLGLTLDAVQVIECATGQVSIGKPLAYAVDSAASILVGSKLFLFGGFQDQNDLYAVDVIQYTNLTIVSSTNGPTIAPISKTTLSPTPMEFPTQTESQVASTTLYDTKPTALVITSTQRTTSSTNESLTTYTQIESTSPTDSSGTAITTTNEPNTTPKITELATSSTIGKSTGSTSSTQQTPITTIHITVEVNSTNITELIPQIIADLHQTLIAYGTPMVLEKDIIEHNHTTTVSVYIGIYRNKKKSKGMYHDEIEQEITHDLEEHFPKTVVEIHVDIEDNEIETKPKTKDSHLTIILVASISLVAMINICGICYWWKRHKPRTDEAQTEKDDVDSVTTPIKQPGAEEIDLHIIVTEGHNDSVNNNVDTAGNGEQENEDVEQEEEHIEEYLNMGRTRGLSAAHLVIVGGNESEDVLMDDILSDVLEMQKADPNKIHQMNRNEAIHEKPNHEEDSDDSDDIYHKN